jgi:magnesium transporter
MKRAVNRAVHRVGRNLLRGGHRVVPPGSSPGTLVAAEPREAAAATPVVLRVLAYGPETLQEWTASSVDDLDREPGPDRPGAPVAPGAPVVWIDVVGLHDLDALRRLGERFGLHPLALEDVLNTGHRPKTEDYGDHRFVVAKAVELGDTLAAEQVSLFFGRGFVLTFQETPCRAFEAVRERIRSGRQRIRASGADYLAYALLDAVIDELFPVLERFGERLEELEEEVVEDPDREVLGRIYRVRRDLLLLRRVAWPQRELIQALERDESGLVTAETKVFLRDAYDHTIHALDFVETYRELAAGMLDAYLSGLSNRMNEVMKVLTIIATIFIPLTFVAGIYGMNFEWMPELGWRLGYPAVMAVMAVVAALMLVYFKRKDWL